MYQDKPADDQPIKFFRSTRVSFLRKLIGAAILVTLLICVGTYVTLNYLNAAPDDFPTEQPITIEPGTDVRTITEIFETAGVVRSGALLYFTLLIFHDTATIKASNYVFAEPQTTTEIARRLTEGDFTTDLIRFTHTEGEPVRTIATRAAATLPDFDAVVFTSLALPYEGKLFPETYFIPPTFSEQELLDLMLQTFTTSIAPLQEMIDEHPLTLDEILILASIIEREASTPESMKIVSGILQNRLNIGMALQTDASMEYVLNKPLSELTPEDLDIDSSYNTYLYPGLPPTPIGNPGLEAIKAVLEPTTSEYFYYLTDSDGIFHYAKTYEEHLRNIERYLR